MGRKTREKGTNYNHVNYNKLLRELSQKHNVQQGGKKSRTNGNVTQ